MESFEFHLKIPFDKRARYSVKTILVVTLLLAVSFGAFKYGKESGYQSGFEKGREEGWSEAQSAKVVRKSYRVSDLVYELVEPHDNGKKTMENLADLKRQIEDEIDPDSWEAKNGPSTIIVYPQELSLVVEQTTQGHNAIAQYLKERRSSK
ncbi:hypothetical protein [Roseiconus lacunae]|uniref:hypothetical protein n=1 Tax=Roseiconus lacunae TaxID=2605694 RepID=UPI0011F0E718|nr:hypothetical protein [Roseiconus lacunae]MCD0460156.1 hypothetical protein [Roseiconus lacunae]